MTTTTIVQNQPRAILIGSAETLSLLADQLALLPDAPLAVGFVLTDGGSVARGFDTLASLPRMVETLRPDLAVVSLPRERASTMLAVRQVLSGLGLPERFVPPLDELLTTPPAPTATSVRTPTNWSELIGRKAHSLDRELVASALTGKRVLITGAGGSIGSEIARIVASFEPAEIVLMERSENALFEIDRQLSERYPAVTRRAVLHDVADCDGTLRALGKHRPHVVFHAAAHKHVPLMEDHPAHAVTNNLLGTKAVADAALACGAERFVLISSDKAVNPTSVMGATKRLAELYVQGLHRTARAVTTNATRFTMVRFGNVLGSACSVIPIWESQLAAGGPLTVTDERMTRFFMTIHEAATLVIQAGAMATAGPDASVYVLDMGQPVRIIDLVTRLIRMRGLTPVLEHGTVGPAATTPGGMTVRIVGSRPGEKLYEELSYGHEQLDTTGHPGIRAWTDERSRSVNIPAMITELSAVRSSLDRDAVLAAIRRYVPEMLPAAATAEAKPLTAPAQAPYRGTLAA